VSIEAIHNAGATHMSEFERKVTVNAEADRVFGFLAQVENMPRYLPTVHDAMPQGAERVRVQGRANGHEYDNDGFFRVDQERRRMEWGSDGEHQYRGWLQVSGSPEDAIGGQAQVTVHLSFEPNAEVGRALKEQTGDRNRTIDEGLGNAMVSIKNLCEGRGGKVESPASNG
jgi:uncharacterized membrane protein